MTTTSTSATGRSRWAAIGAAIAVTLGAGGIGLVNAAASPDGASVFVGTEPCRLLDTRPEFKIGPFDALGADSKITVTASGDVGQCAGPTALPANASALQLNVTAVGASLPTDLRLYPGAGDPPNVSSLNPAPGQGAVPNAVTVRLNDSNQFSIYNFQGSVHLIVDVVGYFTDDFEITGDEVADSSLTKADILDEPGLSYNATVHSGNLLLTPTGNVAGSVRINVPAAGFVTVQSDVNWVEADAGADRATCQIVKAGTSIVDGDPFFRLNDLAGDSSFYTSSSAHRTFPVSTSDNTGTILTGFGVTFNLVCEENAGNVQIGQTYLTAQYFPTNRSPSGLTITVPIFPFPDTPGDEAD